MVDLAFIYQSLSPAPLANIAGFLALLCFFYRLWDTIIRPMMNNSNNSSVLPPPPEVAGAWPILGHLSQLTGSTPLFKTLGNMSDKYGPIFMVRFGMYPTLVVSSWEISKECFTTNDRFLASRPSSAAAGEHLTFAMFGFSSYGPYWREIRKISTIQLLSQRRLGLLKHVPYSEIDNCMKMLYRRWMKNQNQISHHNSVAAGFVKVDMTQVFGELISNVVLKLVVGKRLFTQINNDDEDHMKEDEGHQELHKSTIIEFFKLAGVSVASDVLPFLRWLDVDGQKKKMKRIAKEMDLVADKWLVEHRQKKRVLQTCPAAADGNHDADYDFMSVLISILDEEKDDLFFDYSRDTVIKSTCLNLIVAASDTTSVSLTWVLALLLTNPAVLMKAQDELDTIVGKDRNVEENDISNLIYLQAIIKETLRLYPPGPLGLTHEAIEDCSLGGYEVRSGTRLLVNLWKLHRDPRVWSSPTEFKPERFLPKLDDGNACTSEAATLDFRGLHFEYTPFGSGRRKCPGINFALLSLHMTLARLLHAFDFEYDAIGKLDMTEGSGLTMPKVTPLEVHLRPRLPVTLY
ncbi:hypothetical protein MKW94_019333 [Papaver nudicaule]|uniref:Cytochrome P450 n=1 Tax=Papaver nudicaule TaxID=74823 RepID=A0AA42AXB3_PAPNU|nr:hypothetical protein [Papaver nudicaule]